MTVDETLTTDDITEAVQQIEPFWDVSEATADEHGRDAVYHLDVETEAGEQRAILKATPDGRTPVCGNEARMQTILDAHTTIPVPEVCGVVDQHDSLPAPFLLQSRPEGTNYRGDVITELSTSDVERLARTTGRYLAELHSLDTVDSFGVVTAEEGESLHGNRPRGDPEALQVLDGDNSWATHVESSFERILDTLADSQFSGVQSDVECVAGPMVEALRTDGSFDPVVGRVEHSMDNMLVDLDAGAVTGMLDWEFVASMTPANDLVFAEFWLSGGQWGLLPATPDYRELVREGLQKGYRTTGAATALEEYQAHHECYETLQLLRTMVHFDGMFEAYGATERERTGAKSVLRDRLSEVIAERHR